MFGLTSSHLITEVNHGGGWLMDGRPSTERLHYMAMVKWVTEGHTWSYMVEVST